MNFILGKKLNNGTKDKKKLTAIISIALIILLAIGFVGKNFKVAYKVTLDGSVLGYINNKDEFTCMITNQVLNQDNENMELIVLNDVPEYSLSLISSNAQTDEESIIKVLKLKADVTYKLYAITLGGEDKAYVDTLEEAQNQVNALTEQYKDQTESEFGIREVYTDNMLEYKNMKYATIAKLDGRLTAEKEAKEEAERKAAEEEKARKAAEKAAAREAARKAAQEAEENSNPLTDSYAPVSSGEVSDTDVNGVTFQYSPVEGRISSRYGANESVRNHTHKGLDIAASNGSPIYAVADGTVTYAQFNNGGYGYLVKIDHGNGVETYYAHCSKLYVSAGQTVSAGTCIAAVGSTGHSTGNHLHFEVRINGSNVNPQNYLYN
ncbi:MAG: M23 family metallopeptidase [Clostridia bacterium]|nr:M23 family metallopeptidase [Clostridia bacterium]